MSEEFAGLRGTVGLVTGAATGIGEGVARKLHAAGMRLAIADIDTEGLARVAESLGGSDDVRTFTVDVTDGPAVNDCVAEIEETFGPIDGLAHVVGIQRIGAIVDFSEEDFDATFAINVRAAFLVAKAVAARMLPRERGSIVSVASTAARTPRVKQGAYCGSKAAVAQMMKVLGLELAPHNIRVNCVSPGVTDTGMVKRLIDSMGFSEEILKGSLENFRVGVPMGRLARSEEIADVIAFLLSSRSTYLTMQDIVVDGGGALGA